MIKIVETFSDDNEQDLADYLEGEQSLIPKTNTSDSSDDYTSDLTSESNTKPKTGLLNIDTKVSQN